MGDHDWIVVTREQFFAYVNPRDIILHAERHHVDWETRTRHSVGQTTPGWLGEGPKIYRLTRAAAREVT